MTKAVRAMKEDIKIIDLIIELVDARAPLASRNPDIDSLGAGKARIIILSKADMAEKEVNSAWKQYFNDLGMECLTMDSRKKADTRELTAAVERACREKRERDRKRGILNRPVRAMVAGIPNVGKSTLINTIAGRSAAKTGNMPGVTKGNQWVRLNKGIELLDTPGILWPKFEDEHVGEMMAYIGSINDLIIDPQELAMSLGEWLIRNRPESLRDLYGYTGEDAAELIEAVAERRGLKVKGGEPDRDKAGQVLVNEFRNGKLGRISLEKP